VRWGVGGVVADGGRDAGVVGLTCGVGGVRGVAWR